MLALPRIGPDKTCSWVTPAQKAALAFDVGAGLEYHTWDICLSRLKAHDGQESRNANTAELSSVFNNQAAQSDSAHVTTICDSADRVEAITATRPPSIEAQI
jgi:hypothetical protein